MTEFKHFQFMLLERLIWIEAWNKDENPRLWRFIASSVTFCLNSVQVRNTASKLRFGLIPCLIDRYSIFFRMSPQRATLKKSLCSLSCLLTDFIDFQFMLPTASHLDKGVE